MSATVKVSAGVEVWVKKAGDHEWNPYTTRREWSFPRWRISRVGPDKVVIVSRGEWLMALPLLLAVFVETVEPLATKGEDNLELRRAGRLNARFRKSGRAKYRKKR